MHPSHPRPSTPPSPPLPPPSPPPIPPNVNLIISLALRMHDCRRGGPNTGDDGHEYLNRELGTDFFLTSFVADKRRFPTEHPHDDVSKSLLEQFQTVMCKQPRWKREECMAWLQDFWWVKGLLDREAKRIAREAREVGFEDGRETTRGLVEQVRRIKERNEKIIRDAEQMK